MHNISHQSDTFSTIDEPTLTYHYHSKFILCFTLGAVTVYGFGQMYNDMQP